MLALILLSMAYDPLAVPTETRVVTLDLAVLDSERNRELPIKVYWPAGAKGSPVVLFSHGLGGSREGNAFMGQHWAKRGYVAVFLQHPGSDDSVWRDVPAARRLGAMKQAASSQNFLLRVGDVPAVLNQLAVWNAKPSHPLAGSMDLRHVGMSGHSFGAVTTQAVSGQSYGPLGQAYTDPRIRAAIAFSPNNPRERMGEALFGAVRVPWMLMTGTHDTSLIGDATPRSRQAVFPYLPSTIDRYQVVLFEAEHSAFTERALPGDRKSRNPNHHRIVLALSTAFWDSHLRGNAEAKRWLEGSGARTLMQRNDEWQVRPKGTPSQ